LTPPSGTTPSDLNAPTSIRELQDGLLRVAARGDRRLDLSIGRRFHALHHSYSERWSILLGARFIAAPAGSPEMRGRYGAELAGTELADDLLALVGHAYKPGIARIRSSAESLLDVRERRQIEVTRAVKCVALARLRGPTESGDPDMVSAWPATRPPFLPSSMSRPTPPAFDDGRGGLLVARTPGAASGGTPSWSW